VNPRIVLTRVSGFGQTGPYAKRAGFGTLVEAMSGFAAMTGEVDGPPVLPPFGLADGIAALAAAFSTISALYYRDAIGGTGQVIDLALLEPIMMILGAQATAFDLNGEVPARTGNRIKDVAPRNAYICADGQWVAISSSAQSIAERVMTLVGHPEAIAEPWFATAAGRAENGDLLDAYVADWIATRTQSEGISAFTAAQAAIAPVYDIADIVEDEHVKARNVFIRVDDPDFGQIVVQDVIARLSKTPGRVRFPGRALGQDTDEILGQELGMSQESIAELRAAGIIG
jgi:crotonobetainyl-CoA:carnitine CoA-transferase CaiB-like acyl-CoA transferase